MARFLLDTNTWINLLRGTSAAINARVGDAPPEQVVLCSVVKFELWLGAQKYANREARLALLQALFDQHESFTFDDGVARMAAHIRSHLEQRGQGIGPMDTLIAATAIANNLTLVTNNVREFTRVPDLLGVPSK
jgi:tRNA(fMet)-specific endonuclease VapC